MNPMKIKEIMENVKQKHPLVHNITNYVTVNDCANILLAANASPIMADDDAEVEEITSICNALVINIGTLNERTIAAMVKAGKKASELGHPIVFDPVGAGASNLRTNTAKYLLSQVNCSVIRGNISELKALYTGTSGTQGVDANTIDVITESTLYEGVHLVKQMAKKFGSIIAVTGAIDIVANETEAYVIRNGHEKMRQITGTGCMLTSLIGAYVAANPESKLESVATAVCLMGLSGEKAWDACVKEELGTGSMKTRLIDYISVVTHLDCITGFKGERL